MYFLLILITNLLYSQNNKSNVVFDLLRKNTTDYSIKKADLNLDGKEDIIFYNKWLKGDLMYFFTNNGKQFHLALKTVNFNLDGLFKIEKIESVRKNNKNIVLKIYTISYNKEDIKAIHFISYKNNKWYLQKTQYNAIIIDPLTDKLKKYKCIFNENIVLTEEVNFKLFDTEDQNCVISK